MTLDDLIKEICDEAKISFVSMWHIVNDIESDLKIKNIGEVRANSIKIVSALMEHDIFPGNYTLEGLRQEGFSFWPGTPDELIRRIEDAWTALNRMPDVDDICWFALKRSAKA